MSLEIRELKITGYINKSENYSITQGSKSGFSEKELRELTKKIKSECIEEVLERLERRNRR